MSTEVSIFGAGSAVPAHIAKRELNTNTLALAGNASTGKRISIEGGVFRMIVGGKEVAKSKDRDMNIIIVRTAPSNSRTYYDPAVPYVRGQAQPPTCSSVDGVKPDARVKAPQANSCDKCPQNIAGSGNGESRACRYSRRLAVVLEGDIDGDVYQLQLPATSIFGRGVGTNNLPLEAYARMLASNRVNVDSVVTKMEFDTDASTPKLTFSPARFLTPEELEAVERQGTTTEAEVAIGTTPYALDAGTATAPVAQPEPKEVPVAEPTVAPTKTAKKSGFVPVTEDAPVADSDDEVAQPTATETPKSEKLAKTLAAWGD